MHQDSRSTKIRSQIEPQMQICMTEMCQTSEKRRLPLKATRT